MSIRGIDIYNLFMLTYESISCLHGIAVSYNLSISTSGIFIMTYNISTGYVNIRFIHVYYDAYPYVDMRFLSIWGFSEDEITHVIMQ